MPYAQIGGLDIYHEAHGAGADTLVMAHGALGSVAFAEAFGLGASALARRGLRVVAYDARGHGRSGYSTANADYDQRALADELRLLLDALGLARISLCGTSMGATAALLFAQAHPERVERLVLRSPAPFGDDMVPVRRVLRGLALSYQVLGSSLTSRLAGLRPGQSAAARRRTRALLRGQRRASIVPALRGFLAEPLEPTNLDRIEARALILTQPDDPLHPLRSGDVLFDRLPDAILCVAPTATYWNEHPDATADLIAAFVSGKYEEPQRLVAVRACAVVKSKRPRR